MTPQEIKVFCFFFTKKKAFFFEKKKQKTFTLKSGRRADGR
jgi:hypothetical protein